MKLKKLLCLLLALLMVFSLVACGGDSDSDDDDDDEGGKNADQDPVPTTTAPPEEDTVWLLMKESDMGSSRYTKYIYDENGNLIGGEFYKDSDKWGDYQYVTTPTASGGKIIVESYKHVKDSKFSIHNEYEYDAAGRLIRVVDYDSVKNEPSGWVYTFTYNEAGQLVEQVAAKDGEISEQMTFVYDGDKLMEGHYADVNSFGHYLYTYDAEGKPLKVDVHTYSMDDDSEYTLDFEVEDHGYFLLSATDDCHYVVGGRKLFYYEEESRGGEPYQLYLQAKSWGIFCTGWVPTVALGCMNPSNYFIGAVEMTFMSLDAYLAEQAGS